jgi:hypothetical protein
VLATVHRGQDRGEFGPGADAAQMAEALTALYFDTLIRWLTEADPPFDLQAVLTAKLDLLLAGPAVR